MKKLFLILGIGILLFSCDKKKDVVENSTSNSGNVEKKMELQTFSFPAEVQGCSCYFAKNKQDFENEKYIYVDDYGNNAFIKINEKLIKFPMQEGDFDPSNFEKNLNNGEYKLHMKGEKVKGDDEVMLFQGEISVENKDGEKFSSTIYGECGC